MTTLLVVQPSEIDPPGPLAGWLTDAGAQLRIVAPYLGEPMPETFDGVDGVVCLGGEMGATDDEAHPWLPGVRALLSRAVAGGIPLLAICLGAQLLAVARGGAVQRMDKGAEAGVRLVAKRDAAAADPLLGTLPFTPDVLQYHYDEVSRLPAGAALLAVSPHCTNQAFRIGACAWGLQFHIETTPDLLRRWMAADPDFTALVPASQRPDAPNSGEVLDRAHADIAETWQPVAARFVELAAHPPIERRELPIVDGP